MPLRWVVVGAIGVAVVLVGACGPQQVPQEESPSASLAMASPTLSPSPGITAAWPPPGVDSSELQSTGWRLVGVPLPEDWTSLAWFKGPDAMVADGAGHVWIRSGWQIIRVDAASGESKSWDAGDDAVFASPGLTLAPASGSAVWLLDGGRLRLFDGARFVVDLQVPAEVLDVSDATGRNLGTVKDVVARGSELWVSLDFTRTTVTSWGPYGAQVLRWSDSQWSQMSELVDGIGGDLAVDSGGRVWAGGQGSLDGHDQGVKRWEGDHWALPGEGATSAPPGDACGTVKVDRQGAVWFLNTPGDGGLYRFDGNHWKSWSGSNGGWAVSGGGDAWVIVGADPDARSWVTRFTSDGAAQVYGLEHGISEYVSDIEVTSGGDVLVMAMQGVLRLSGDKFTRIWKDDVTPFFGTLVAVSEDEVWISGGSARFRADAGGWRDMGLPPSGDCPTVIASDGAAWVPTPEGLVRQTADGRHVVATRTDICWGMLAGPNGSLWIPDDSGVTRYSADVAQTPIPWPGQTDHECLKATGPDGSVWVSAETEPGESGCDDPNNISRWDGRRWTPVDPPPIVSLGPMAVTDDGAAWATSWSSESHLLGRYANGRWTSHEVHGLGWLTALSGGRICGMEHTNLSSDFMDAIACYDANGEVAKFDLKGMGVRSSSIAPDGSIWVVGDQVAQLDETLPME